jgi:hypothetical protein
VFKLNTQELLEQVYSDNRHLRKRLTELEQGQEEIETTYSDSLAQLRRTFEAKVAALERTIKEKDETVKGLKTRVVMLQASYSSYARQKGPELPQVEGLIASINDKIESLKEATRENFSLVREQLDLIDGAEREPREVDYEPSSIQEEAPVEPVRSTHPLRRSPQVVSINLAQLESSIESSKTSQFSTIYSQESSLNASVATPDLRRKLRSQRALIQKHEAFINQLKGTLETLLGERLGSKKQSNKSKLDLMELRSLLRLEESLRG